MATHNGSVRINSGAVITPSVDLPQYARLRATDWSTRVVHDAGPLSDAERLRHEAFAVHSTAQAAAQRRGPVVIHTPEQVNARAIAAAQRVGPATDAQATAALVARVQRLADLVETQREVIDVQTGAIADLHKRLADLDGNAFVGGESE